MYQFKLENEENIRVSRSVASKMHLSHTHDFIEVVYICEGSGNQIINENSYTVDRGDLLFINFNDVHSYSTDTGMEYINCLISPDFLSDELINSKNALDILTLAIFRDFYDVSGKMCPKLSFHGHEMLDIETIFNNMIIECQQKAPGYMVVLKSYINIMLTKIFRIFKKPEHNNLTTNLAKVTPEVLQYIKNNYNRKITLEELSKRSFYNAAYFSTIFKECFGKTPLEYINEIRIAEAIQLIKQTDLTIEEISCKVGYNNKKHFYKIFKKATGMTPLIFRKD